MGDLNEIQTLALLAVLRADEDEKDEKEWRDFRSMIFAMHPAEGKLLLDAIDKARDDTALAEHNLAEFAPALTDEEMEGYVPFSDQEAEEAIALLRRFGVASVGQ